MGESPNDAAGVEPHDRAVPNVRSDHYCFGCGALNPWGLKLHFFTRDDLDGVWAPWTPLREHEGYGGIVHGGIVTTVLDEVMAWAAYRRDIWVVTAKIAVNFRHPVTVDAPTRAAGRVVRDRGRIVELAGEIRAVADGRLLAEATGVFMRVPPDQAAAWRDRYVVQGGA